MNILVSIVIPVFNRAELTLQCLQSVVETVNGCTYEVVVVDNNSSDETQVLLQRFQKEHSDVPMIVVRNDENLGFAKACNQGANQAQGRFLIFLNNDIIALPGWVEPLLAVLESDEQNGIVGPKLINPDQTIQHAGIIIRDVPAPITGIHLWWGKPRDFPPAQVQRECQAVTGACLGIRKRLFEELDGFDENFMNGCEDLDLCFRVREKGFRVVYVPLSELVHLESQSEGRYIHSSDNIILLNIKWKGRVCRDTSQHIPPVSIILVDYFGAEDTIECLGSLFGLQQQFFHGSGLFYKKFNVVVVENSGKLEQSYRVYDWCLRNQIPCEIKESQKEIPASVRGKFRSGGVTILRAGKNLGFAAGCNLGLRYALSEGAQYTWLLNNDTLVHPLSLWYLISTMHMGQKKGFNPGIVGSTLRCFDQPERVQFDGYRVYYGGCENTESGLDQKTQIVPFVSGASILVSRKVWQDAGFMDEDFFLYYEDNELCRRCSRLGFQIFYQPLSIIYHKGGSAIGNWLQSSVSIFYATRSYLLYHEKLGVLDRTLWMALKASIWDGMMKTRENVNAFFEGLLDFLSGGKGPRRRDVVPKDVSLVAKDSYEAQMQNLLRFFSRIQEHDLRDPVVLNLLNTTYEFYESWKAQILALRLRRN